MAVLFEHLMDDHHTFPSAVNLKMNHVSSRLHNVLVFICRESRLNEFAPMKPMICSNCHVYMDDLIHCNFGRNSHIEKLMIQLH